MERMSIYFENKRYDGQIVDGKVLLYSESTGDYIRTIERPHITVTDDSTYLSKDSVRR